MAIEKVVNLKVTDDFAKTETAVKGLKTQLREAQADVAKMADLFGATSQQTIEAAKRAAELKDKIEDARETVDLFDPGKKFQAFTTGATQLAAGFSAVQGAMALAGTESADLQKQMLKVQGAIALTQGLSELKDLGKSYQQLKIVAVNSFKAIKLAIGGTGIGLIVVALGLLVANWDAIKKAVTDAFPALKNTESIMNKLTEVAYGVGNAIKSYILMPFKAIGKLLTGDFKGAVNEIKNGLDVVGNYSKGASDERQSQLEAANKKRLEALVAQKEKEIEVEKAKGKDTYKMELDNLRRKQQLSKDDKEALAKLQQEERVLIATHQKKVSDEDAAHKKELRAKQKEHDDKLKQQKEEAEKKEQERIRKQRENAREEYEKAFEIQKDAAKQFADLGKSEQQKEIEAVEAKYTDKIAALKKAGLNTAELVALQEDEINKIKAKFRTKDDDDFSKSLKTSLEVTGLSYEDKKAIIAAAEQAITDNATLTQEQRTQRERELAAARKEISSLEVNDKLRALDVLGQAMTSASQLAGEQTAAGKALAIAAATVNTYVAASTAFKQAQLNPISILGTAYPYIMAGLAVVQGLKQVQAIASVPIPSVGGGGGGGGSAGGGAASAPAPPNFNIVGQNSTNQLAQTIAGKQAQPVKAYVVSGEVSTGQSLDRNRVKTATFGG